MGPRRADQEPTPESPLLMPQSDGYADYVDQAQGPGQDAGREPGRPGYAGRRRKDRRQRAARQRSIRSTITILLVIPLLSLVALWAYAAAGTVGGAIAKSNDDTLSRDLGGPIQGLLQQLAAERTATFAWQSAHGAMPRAVLTAQRARTDAAIAAFRAGAAAGAGLEPPAAKPLVAALLGQLSHVTGIRAGVDAGAIAPLAAFAGYDSAVNAIYPFGAALNSPQESMVLYRESQAALAEGEAFDDIGQEAALVSGVLATGGTMSAAEDQVFVRAVDDQRLLEQLGGSPLDWQSPDPYPRVFASPAFAAFQALENEVVASRPGARLPVSARSWRAGVGRVVAEFSAGENAARLGSAGVDTSFGDVVLLRLIIVGGAGLVAVLISSVLLIRFGNRISRELTGLRGAARALAAERLPSVVSRLRAGEEVDVAVEAPPLELGTRTREVTETADAFSAVQRTAVEAAVEQAQLRKGVSLVFRSLARRNQSLLQRQLRLLDEMERGTEDPDALAQLFRLDHLTTRMRRQAEGLIILSGAAPGRTWRQPVSMVEVVRGAIGEIEDFTRVDLVADLPDCMRGTAVADVTHMLAELIENAVQYSPPGTRVKVGGGRVASGYVIEVADRGLGIAPDTLSQLNERLARPPEFDLADSDQLGLFVVSRLAARHGARISLHVPGYGATTAVVLLPSALIVAEEEAPFPAGTSGPRDARPSAPRPAGLPRREPTASIAPQPRETRPGTPAGPLAGRSPEQARALMSAIQQGWRSGRGASTPQDDDRGPPEEAP